MPVPDNENCFSPAARCPSYITFVSSPSMFKSTNLKFPGWRTIIEKLVSPANGFGDSGPNENGCEPISGTLKAPPQGKFPKR